MIKDPVHCICILVAATCLAILWLMGPEPSTYEAPNGSSDGRYHTCGYVTEDGVTEHLDAYAERCGDLTYASDTP